MFSVYKVPQKCGQFAETFAGKVSLLENRVLHSGDIRLQMKWILPNLPFFSYFWVIDDTMNALTIVEAVNMKVTAVECLNGASLSKNR